MEYRKVLNSIALNVLLHDADIPDYHLMVGTAEELAPLPLLIPQHKIPKDVASNLSKLNTLSNDQITNAINDNMLEINDFNGNTALLAQLIGG